MAYSRQCNPAPETSPRPRRTSIFSSCTDVLMRTDLRLGVRSLEKVTSFSCLFDLKLSRPHEALNVVQ